MNRYTVAVGALFRRHFRRSLLCQGIRFSEDKGLLSSLFVLTCSDDERRTIERWIDWMNEHA